MDLPSWSWPLPPTLPDRSRTSATGCYESVHSWVMKFGPMIARGLRQLRPRSSDSWHLDEMVVRIAGKRMYLWRAVDHEGEILDVLVQCRRDRCAAVTFVRKLLRKQGFAPNHVITDQLRSYGAALRHLGLGCHHEQGLRKNIVPRIRAGWCADPSARCSALQVTGIGAMVPEHACRGVQQLQPPASSHFPLDDSNLSIGSRGASAQRHCCRMIDCLSYTAHP
jgi:hypothetical protein